MLIIDFAEIKMQIVSVKIPRNHAYSQENFARLRLISQTINFWQTMFLNFQNIYV